jgi:hypothetical protein
MILLQKHDNNIIKSLQRYIPQIGVEKLEIMWDFISIYTHWAPSSKKIFKKFSTLMWPMFIRVWFMSIYVGVNSELGVN